MLHSIHVERDELGNRHYHDVIAMKPIAHRKAGTLYHNARAPSAGDTNFPHALDDTSLPARIRLWEQLTWTGTE